MLSWFSTTSLTLVFAGSVSSCTVNIRFLMVSWAVVGSAAKAATPTVMPANSARVVKQRNIQTLQVLRSLKCDGFAFVDEYMPPPQVLAIILIYIYQEPEFRRTGC